MPEKKKVASPKQQMARLSALTRLKRDVEKVIEHYRDFSRDELATEQFAVLILAAVADTKGVAFALDPVKDDSTEG